MTWRQRARAVQSAFRSWCAEAGTARARFCMETRAALQQSNTHLWRVGLALGMTIRTGAMLMGESTYEQLHSTTLMSAFWSLWVWVALNAIGAGLLWWRLLDHRARIEWQIYVNVYVTLLLGLQWALVSIDTRFIMGADGFVLLAAAVWLTFRSGFTHLDKDQA